MKSSSVSILTLLSKSDLDVHGCAKECNAFATIWNMPVLLGQLNQPECFNGCFNQIIHKRRVLPFDIAF